MVNISSDAYYDKIGKSYREISCARSKYIDAVDTIVVATAKKLRIKSWLDIGVGDGKRLSNLLTKLDISDVACLESSKFMIQEASRNLGGQCDIINQCLSSYSQKSVKNYSFVTALWNVIGHSKDHVSFLRDAYSLVDKGGTLLIDANNRYNIRQYGFYRVIKNFVLDFIGIEPKGIFKLRAKDSEEFTNVYIASPGDIRKACNGLNIENLSIVFVDYSTGKSAGFLTGQMVVTISKS